MPKVMGACKRKSMLILYMGKNSVKENSSFRIKIKKKKSLPLASNPRKNQAAEQFWCLR